MGFKGIDSFFGDADRMFEDLKSSSFSGGNGQYVKQTYTMKEKRGPDGRPLRETYSTKASGILDENGRTKIGERN